MPGNRDIRAGGAFVELFTKDTALEKGLRRSAARLKAFGAQIAGIGTRIFAGGAGFLAPLLGAVAKFTSTGNALQKLSTQTGASVAELTRLQFIAGQLGVDFDDVAGSIEELNIRLGETIRDAKGPAAEALQQLGLDAKTLAELPVVERLKLIGDALSRIQNNTTRGFLADEIFGGDAFKILPILREGAAGIDRLIGRAEELGVVMSGEQAAAAAEMSRNWSELTMQLKAIVVEVGGALVPALVDLAKFAAPVLRAVIDWVRENPKLVTTIAAVAAGAVALGAGLVTAGAVIAATGTIIGAFVAVIGLVKAAIVALLSPVGLVTAAIVGATGAWIAFTDDGAKAAADSLDVLKGKFDTIKATVLDVWGSITQAIEAGRLDLAFKAAWLGVQVVWLESLDGLLQIWENFADPLKMRLIDFRTYLLKTFSGLGSAIRVVWIGITGGIKIALLRSFEQIAGIISGGLGGMLAKIGKALRELPGGEDIGSKLNIAGQALRGLQLPFAFARIGAERQQRKDLTQVGFDALARDKEIEAKAEALKQQVADTTVARRKERQIAIDEKRKELQQVQEEIAKAYAALELRNLTEGAIAGALSGSKTRPDIAATLRNANERVFGSFSGRVINQSRFGGRPVTEMQQQKMIQLLERMLLEMQNNVLVFRS